MDHMNAAFSTLSLSSKPSNRSGKISWPESSSMKQFFTLPDSVIYYISKNPSSPEIYLKLAKSCKYFFEKNPILIAAKIRKIHNNKTKMCSCAWRYEGLNKNEKCCVNVNFAKISISKIWLFDELELYGNNISKIASIILPKIYRCERAQISLHDGKMIFKDFKILTACFQKFSKSLFKVIDDVGNVILLESILEAIPNVKKFSYRIHQRTPSATMSTMKNIFRLKNLDNLRHFYLWDIPEFFAVGDLASFIENR